MVHVDAPSTYEPADRCASGTSESPMTSSEYHGERKSAAAAVGVPPVLASEEQPQTEPTTGTSAGYLSRREWIFHRTTVFTTTALIIAVVLAGSWSTWRSRNQVTELAKTAAGSVNRPVEASDHSVAVTSKAVDGFQQPLISGDVGVDDKTEPVVDGSQSDSNASLDSGPSVADSDARPAQEPPANQEGSPMEVTSFTPETPALGIGERGTASTLNDPPTVPSLDEHASSVQAEIQRKLSRPIRRIRFGDIRLHDFLAVFQDLCDVPLKCPQETLAAVGVDRRAMVSLDVADATCDEILREAIVQLGLTYEIAEGWVVVIPTGSASQ